MQCVKCEAKMKCIYSVPVGKTCRYRIYRCRCNSYEETLEVPESKIASDEIKAILRHAREDRFRLMMNIRKAKSG